MNFLHYEFDLSTNEVVEVTLDQQANVAVDLGSYAGTVLVSAAYWSRHFPHRFFLGTFGVPLA